MYINTTYFMFKCASAKSSSHFCRVRVRYYHFIIFHLQIYSNLFQPCISPPPCLWTSVYLFSFILIHSAFFHILILTNCTWMSPKQNTIWHISLVATTAKRTTRMNAMTKSRPMVMQRRPTMTIWLATVAPPHRPRSLYWWPYYCQML